MTTKSDIEQLFRSNYGPMLVLATRLVHDDETARDIVHDVFAALISSPVAEVTQAYLLTGVRFACLKHLRSLSVRERVARLLALELSDIADNEWPDEDDIRRIRTVIGSLPERTRQIVMLRFSAALKYSEIAHELSISEVAVYKHLKEALNVLRQNFHCNDR